MSLNNKEKKLAWTSYLRQGRFAALTIRERNNLETALAIVMVKVLHQG